MQPIKSTWNHHHKFLISWICSIHLKDSDVHRYSKSWLISTPPSLKDTRCEIKWAGGLWKHLTFLETLWSPVLKFCDELPCFSKPIWITHLQIPHGARWNVYLSNDTKLGVQKSSQKISCWTGVWILWFMRFTLFNQTKKQHPNLIHIVNPINFIMMTDLPKGYSQETNQTNQKWR
jgi:hypothetical protein